MQDIREFHRDLIVVDPSNTASSAVIMLHGLGANAADLSSLAEYLQLPQKNIRFVFPNAPLLPVSLNGGMLMPAWYDILGLAEDSKQDEQGIYRAKDYIEHLIDEEYKKGIPYERILLGGFSQGGALALFSGLHCSKKIGGIIGLSTYLPIADKLFPQHQLLSVYLAHGSFDDVIPMRWAKMAADTLRSFECEVEWHDYPVAHTINQDMVIDLKKWMETRLA